jgi:hypothetical protein
MTDILGIKQASKLSPDRPSISMSKRKKCLDKSVESTMIKANFKKLSSARRLIYA